MDLFEAQDFFTKAFPGKNIDFEFDENCHRFNEIVLTDGKPNLHHHIEHHNVKVSIEGNDPVYVPIEPHRETCTWAYMKNLIGSKADVHINDEHLEIAKDSPEKIKELMLHADLSAKQIQEKVEDYKKRTAS